MRENLIMTRAAELNALPVFREFIARVGYELQVPAETIFELQLACDEAATNVITHGYAGMNPGSLMLEVRAEPQAIMLLLSDFGHSFEPVETAVPDVNALMNDQPTTGFGLYFIYSVMDEVSYFTDEQGNHLILTKKLVPKQTSSVG